MANKSDQNRTRRNLVPPHPPEIIIKTDVVFSQLNCVQASYRILTAVFEGVTETWSHLCPPNLACIQTKLGGVLSTLAAVYPAPRRLTGLSRNGPLSPLRYPIPILIFIFHPFPLPHSAFSHRWHDSLPTCSEFFTPFPSFLLPSFASCSSPRPFLLSNLSLF